MYQPQEHQTGYSSDSLMNTIGPFLSLVSNINIVGTKSGCIQDIFREGEMLQVSIYPSISRV